MTFLFNFVSGEPIELVILKWAIVANQVARHLQVDVTVLLGTCVFDWRVQIRVRSVIDCKWEEL